VGGIGSTRWSTHKRAKGVEDCFTLTTLGLTKSMAELGLADGWDRYCGFRFEVWQGTPWQTTVAFENDPHTGLAMVMRHKAGDGRMSHADHDYRVSITTTRPNYGGIRYLYMCPGCGGRAAKLYRPTPSDSFLCRRCHDLVYRSQQAHDRRLDCFRRLPPEEFWRALNDLPLYPDVPDDRSPSGWRAALRVFLATSRMQRLYERVLSVCETKTHHTAAYYAKRRARHAEHRGSRRDPPDLP